MYIHHWVELRKTVSHIPSHLLRPALHKAGAPKCATHVPFTLRPWEKWRKKSCGKNLLPFNSLLISEICAFHQLSVVFLPTDINVVCTLAKAWRKTQYSNSHVCQILQMQRLCSLSKFNVPQWTFFKGAQSICNP